MILSFLFVDKFVLSSWFWPVLHFPVISFTLKLKGTLCMWSIEREGLLGSAYNLFCTLYITCSVCIHYSDRFHVYSIRSYSWQILQLQKENKRHQEEPRILLSKFKHKRGGEIVGGKKEREFWNVRFRVQGWQR